MKELIDKNVKLFIGEGDKATIFTCVILDVTDEFVKIKDKFGKIIFVNRSKISRIEEAS